MNKAGTSLCDSESSWCILPIDLLRETVCTLNLLFPLNDVPTEELLIKEGRTFHNEVLTLTERPLELRDYPYWRGRLEELLRVAARDPESLQEFLYKKQAYEKMLQVYFGVFFGFILAIVFGCISSVTAVISTRAALRGLDISREALEVAQQALVLQGKVPVCPCAP